MKKLRRTVFLLLGALLLNLFGGCTVKTVKDINIVSETGTDFVLFYNRRAEDGFLQAAYLLSDMAKSYYGAELKTAPSTMKKTFDNEIIVGASRGEEYMPLYNSLEENEYAIKLYHYAETGKNRLVIAYKGLTAAMRAVGLLCEKFNPEGFTLPENYEVRGKCSSYESCYERIPGIVLRDPNVLVENGTYYMYGTGWQGYKNTSGSLTGEWVKMDNLCVIPEDAEDCFWAPEVHKYKDNFYMFTTYRSKTTGHRGCTVMKASSPEGPFVELSDGHFTPKEWDSIDATLYVDKEGQPWCVFVHEWTSTGGKGGYMDAARMTDDLTALKEEPKILFNANDPKWSAGGITDGCYLYETENGKLLMIWSNWDEAGYCIGVARSESGRVEGPWTQDYQRVYSKYLCPTYDGGHGTLFKALDGNLYVSFHSPNGGDIEAPTFIRLKEVNGFLLWDIKDDEIK